MDPMLGCTPQILPAHARLFEFLKTVAKERNLSITLRVAGGWVRDSLLGIPSHDIDLTIETHAVCPPGEHSTSEPPAVSGEQFAREILEYQKLHNMTQRTLSVIRVNPEMSKHIETATMNVFDMPVEFCALRKDVYDSVSRVPTIAMATPEEDAKRRDFTVNSLFLNLDTMQVEDYTTGLQDLQNRVLRCPLDPHVTFLDDPLRLLRCVRFAGQLGFRVDDSILQCMDATLVDALKTKVSRERVGIEVGKMFSCAEPPICVELLGKLSLLQEVVLVERVMQQSPSGKHKHTAEVCRDDRLVDSVASPDVALAEVWCLNECVGRAMLCASREVVHQNQHQQPQQQQQQQAGCGNFNADRVVGVLFLLVWPFYRHASSGADELQTRVYDLCVHGLKLPVATYEGLRRMVQAAAGLQNALACSSTEGAARRVSHAFAEQPHLAYATKCAIFDALSVLNEKRVPQGALELIVAALTCLDVTHAPSCPVLWSEVEPIVHNVTSDKALMSAFVTPIPLKGNELPNLLGIPTNEIGGALVEARRHMALSACSSKEELVAFLKKKRASGEPFRL